MTSSDTPEVLSAGGVVVRTGPGGPEVALAEQIDWNTQERNVRLPKGHLEDGESLEAAALREVEEEVGLRARIVERLSDVRYRFWHHAESRFVPKRVVFFLMTLESGDGHPADGAMETVFWADFETAAARLSFDSERAVVAEARALLASRNPPGP